MPAMQQESELDRAIRESQRTAQQDQMNRTQFQNMPFAGNDMDDAQLQRAI